MVFFAFFFVIAVTFIHGSISQMSMTNKPTSSPSNKPTRIPTLLPTATPKPSNPSQSPTLNPTYEPTFISTPFPTLQITKGYEFGTCSFIGSGTSGICRNQYCFTGPTCPIYACPGTVLTVNGCPSATGANGVTSTGSPGVKLLDASGNTVVPPTVVVSQGVKCPQFTYTVPTTSTCQNYFLWGGCAANSPACSSTVYVSTNLLPTYQPTFEPTLSPTFPPTVQPSATLYDIHRISSGGTAAAVIMSVFGCCCFGAIITYFCGCFNRVHYHESPANDRNSA